MNPAHIPIPPDYEPRLPAGGSPGIGIIGCGGIVKQAHLPAYNKYGLRVVGVYDIAPDATQDVCARFGVERVFDTLDDLLAHPEITVVDIATGPAQRAPLIVQALEAGKHVLAQKPLTLDLKTARNVVEKAQQCDRKLAVNQNGRWAPPWRIATRLVEQGVIGEILAVTHLYDMNFRWIVGTAFDAIAHLVIYDYSIHWFDITRCWLADRPISHISTREYRTPDQPPDSIAPWGMWVEIAYAGGASAVIRGVGCSQTRRNGHPFWVHGTEGVIRGSVLGNDFVELEKEGVTCRYALEGQWFPDGFAGAMGELLCAIAEDREPYNSARHNLRSLDMALTACRSAEAEGRLLPLEATP